LAFSIIACVHKTFNSNPYYYALNALVSVYNSVSQPPGRGPVPGPGISYTGPRETTRFH